jgi:hypothetical protein
MQFDEQVTAALSALGPQIALFRFAISATLERARNTLAAESGPNRTEVMLGDFAAGRIDPQRFAMISSGSAPLDRVGRAVIERAVEVLESLLKAPDQEFVVRVQPGGSPTTAVRTRMTALGAAFGASVLVELVRRRTYDILKHDSPLEGYPFERWTTSERKLAPPLVVLVDGRDLEPFELAPLIDGCVRLVFLVKGSCSPAPLARLISPGVFVAQSTDEKVLEKIADFGGPAVVAIMKGDEARFVHDPRAGSQAWQRTHVTYLPAAPARKSLGARSAWQQREDLLHLKSLVTPPALAGERTSMPPTVEDATEKIAAWLIGQAGLQGGMS